MAIETVSLKLTHSEIDLAEWLLGVTKFESMSDLLRGAMVELARAKGASTGLLHEVEEWRRVHPIRRSKKICRLIGQREGVKKNPRLY